MVTQWSLSVVTVSNERHHCVWSPQHGQQAEGDARRTGVDVDPERHPGQDDDENGRNVDLDEKVTDVAAQYETNLEAGKNS